MESNELVTAVVIDESDSKKSRELFKRGYRLWKWIGRKQYFVKK
jgi:hypothetical protein